MRFISNVIKGSSRARSSCEGVRLRALHQQPGDFAAGGAAVDKCIVAVLTDRALRVCNIQRCNAAIVAQHILQRCRAAEHRLDKLQIRRNIAGRHTICGAQFNS